MDTTDPPNFGEITPSKIRSLTDTQLDDEILEDLITSSKLETLHYIASRIGISDFDGYYEENKIKLSTPIEYLTVARVMVRSVMDGSKMISTLEFADRGDLLKAAEEMRNRSFELLDELLYDRGIAIGVLTRRL